MRLTVSNLAHKVSSISQLKVLYDQRLLAVFFFYLISANKHAK